VLEQQVARSQRLESLGRLAGGVAGDLSHLLSILQAGATGLLSSLEEEHPGYPYLRDIIDAVRSAGLLSHRLLAFNSSEKLEPEPLNLNAFLVETESTVRAVLNEQIEFRVSLNPELGDIYVDAGRMTELVINIVLNARDAMPDRGVLTISTANVDVDVTLFFPSAAVPAGRYVQLAISDTGTGMPADAQAYGFEPGFTTKDRGRGYGLSTVYGIVSQSGGYVWAETNQNGTTVNCIFPRVGSAASTRSALSKENSAREGETILVVDDHEELRVVTAAVLRRFGYHVLEAESGKQAVTVAREHPGSIHLLITPFVVHDIGRAELLAALKQSRPEMKGLCTSPFSMVPHAAGESHIQMPFTTDALTRKVRALLDDRE
jgi:CheY-like chemotaxis protein